MRCVHLFLTFKSFLNSHMNNKRPSAEELLNSTFIRSAPQSNTPLVQLLSRHKKWGQLNEVPEDSQQDEGDDLIKNQYLHDNSDLDFYDTDPDSAWVFDTIRQSLLPQSLTPLTEGLEQGERDGIGESSFTSLTDSHSGLDMGTIKRKKSSEHFLDFYSTDIDSMVSNPPLEKESTSSIDWPTIKFKDDSQITPKATADTGSKGPVQSNDKELLKNASVDWMAIQQALDSSNYVRSALHSEKTSPAKDSDVSSAFQGLRRPPSKLEFHLPPSAASMSLERKNTQMDKGATTPRSVGSKTTSPAKPKPRPQLHQTSFALPYDRRRNKSNKRRQADGCDASGDKPESGAETLGFPKPFNASFFSPTQDPRIVHDEFENRKKEARKLLDSLSRYVSIL